MTNEKLGNTVCQNSDKPIIEPIDTKKELSNIAHENDWVKQICF